MGHFGFSYIGVTYLLMLFIPNLIWIKNKPEDYEPNKENKILSVFERVGQISTTCAAIIFTDFNIQGWDAWTSWLVLSFLLMVLYECWWLRYFMGRRTMAEFYDSFLGIPVAGAVLPTAAFFLLGVYGKVIWMMLSTIILGIGHIGIHIRHLKEIK